MIPIKTIKRLHRAANKTNPVKRSFRAYVRATVPINIPEHEWSPKIARIMRQAHGSR